MSGVATLVLADGRVFTGEAFGARTRAVGEVVFNTALTGYQEILTDPSYRRQLVCLTAVEIGNVGVNPADEESQGPGAAGLLCRSLSPSVSNYRATGALPEYLAARGVPGIAGIDTRALTRHLREAGAMMGALATDGASVEELRALVDAAPPMAGAELVSEVTTDAPYAFEQPSWGRARPSPRVHVVVFDFGVKRNILRRLVDAGARVTVVPARTKLEALEELAPDGVLLSNGPGDPAAVSEVISEVRRILEARPALPVFGICLGHQILCLALGGRTYKLKFGHHGGNHPVRSERGGRVAITAQNHGFAVDLSSLGPAELDQVNLFDGTVAGFRLRDRPVWGVQYHPEDAPGPHDANPLIAEFVQTVARVAGAA